ncbi:MAG: alkyl sulfatase BDS1-like metallo-beta-lactamase superfamily hydrolase [Bacteroidia bacterium]|jgi:alkyl sulfatase BDS1-like metallo-beta-lactamase superfamily hydrolase
MGVSLIFGCTNDVSDNVAADDLLAAPQPGHVTQTTRAANLALAKRLPLADQSDFQDASRGFLAAIEAPAILNADGDSVWDIAQYDFVTGPAPDTVNPSLWRQGELVAKHGLFEVVPGIWQVRGYDLAVMTIVRGQTGWIVIDPLLNVETAAASLALVNKTLGERPVSALIYTHSHTDHYGGARGVLPSYRGDVPVIAPHNFTRESASENVIAGNHMSRRVALMFGSTLPRSATGHVSAGLGPGLPSGSVSLIVPSEELPKGLTNKVIDGVEFEFMDLSGTEAPSEFVFYLPQFRALHTAEVVSGTLHNVLTMRGAKSRDALAWSQGINSMLQRYGDKSDVVLASHHWPKWQTARVQDHLRKQRDVYRYIHDSTIRAANQGASMFEAAESMKEPAFMSQDFSSRGYYGTLNHNSKAVYQHYFGWWSGVPAQYHKLPPERGAKKYVAAMGGSQAAIRVGIEAYQAGDFRWAAEVLNHVVFAKAGGQEAKNWLAASYEQMAYQAESGAWRSYFLTGAQELRSGLVAKGFTNTASTDVQNAVPTATLLNLLAVQYSGQNIADPFDITFNFADSKEILTVELKPSMALVRPGRSVNAIAVITLTRPAFDKLLSQQTDLKTLVAAGEINIEGDADSLVTYVSSLERPSVWFNVVEP